MRLDLNSPQFQEVFFNLEPALLKQVTAGLRRLSSLGWEELYRHPGLRWEAMETLRAPNGGKIYSLRLSQRVRALGFREGEWLRLLSLHPEHDSAYRV